jgi:hypothetical protein
MAQIKMYQLEWKNIGDKIRAYLIEDEKCLER